MNSESHAGRQFDGATPFFFRTIRRHERKLYIAIATILSVLLTIQVIRKPANEVTAGNGDDYDLNAKYVAGNHKIRVYTSKQGTAIFTSPDFQNRYNSKDGYIMQGDLFIIDDAGDGIQSTSNPNEPHDNESIFHFKRIYILREGRLQKRYIVDYSTHSQGKKEIATNHGLRGRYDSLLGHAYAHSQYSIYGDSSPYHYAGNGLYSITTQANTRLYNTAGNPIDTLPAGTKLFAGFDSDFATGHNRPTLLRIAGFKAEDGIENYATYFVDIFAGNDSEFEYTFITE